MLRYIGTSTEVFSKVLGQDINLTVEPGATVSLSADLERALLSSGKFLSEHVGSEFKKMKGKGEVK